MSKDYYVYAWTTKETNDYFYIGKGKGKRYKQTSGRNDYFNKYLSKYKCLPLIIKGELTEKEALDYEKHYIKFYREKGMAKCNFLDGGDINPRYKGAEHARSRKVVQLTEEGNFIKIFDCVRDGVKSVNGHDAPVIRSLKRGLCAYGYRWVYFEEYDPKRKYKIMPKYNQKQIIQFTITGEFIKEWSSIVEASRNIGVTAEAIGMCCKQKTKQSGGYVWKYK